MSDPVGRRTRIAFLVTWPDHVGGTERATFRLAGALAADHDVEVIGVVRDADRPFFDVPDGVRFGHLVDRRATTDVGDRATGLVLDDPASLDAQPSAWIEDGWEPTLTVLTDLAFDAAMAHDTPDVIVTTTPSLMALAAQRAPDSVVVLHAEHRATPFRGSSGRPLPLYASRVDGIVCLTDDSVEWLELLLGPSAPRLAAIPNMLSSDDAPRSAGTELVVTAAGRFTTEKQFDHLVRAFRRSVPSRPGWRLRLFGDGPEEARLRHLAARDETGSIEILPSTDQLAAELAASSILVMSSKHEGFPLIALEALAAGLPIVSYDCPTGPRRIIRHGETGLLVPPDDLAALTEALSGLMDDEERRRSMAQAAWQSRTEYLPEAIAARWTDLIATVLADRAALPFRSARSVARTEHVRPAPGASLVPAGRRRAQVLDVVVDALTSSGAVWFALRPDNRRVRLAVDQASRPGLLAALHDHPGALGLFATPALGVLRYKVLVPLDHPAFADLVRADEGLRILPDSPSGHRDKDQVGVEILFCRTSSRGRVLHAPTNMEATSAVAVADIGSTVRRVADRELPSLATFSTPTIHEPTMPIDVVYTWVDDSDPVWRDQFEDRLARAKAPHEDAASPARFRDNGELRYSLRSLREFAPWIRNVYLVTADQVPTWLDTTAPGLTVVSHRDIFADPEHLPTFNSHAIEAHLHDIDGLSENFLYLNDDIVFGREVVKDQFVTAGGITRFFTASAPIGFDGVDGDTPPLWAARNNRTLIEARFGQTVPRTMALAPHSLRRSVLAEIVDVWPDEVRRTSAAAFRRRKDLSIASALHHHYAAMTGRAVAGSIGYTHVMTTRRDHLSRYGEILRAGGEDVIALGDHHISDISPEERRDHLTAFLEALLPTPSPWELRA